MIIHTWTKTSAQFVLDQYHTSPITLFNCFHLWEGCPKVTPMTTLLYNSLSSNMGEICNLLLTNRMFQRWLYVTGSVIWLRWWNAYIRRSWEAEERDSSANLEEASCCAVNCLKGGPHGKELCKPLWGSHSYNCKELNFAINYISLEDDLQLQKRSQIIWHLDCSLVRPWVEIPFTLNPESWQWENNCVGWNY